MHPLSKLPIMKPTRVLTSDPELANQLSACRCPGHAKHACLECNYKGSSLTKRAETYPQGLCRKVAQVVLNRDQDELSDVDIFVGSEDDADSERESEPPGDPPPPEAVAPRVRAPNYKALVQKLHTNMGHASIPQMLRLAQRARAPAPVLQAIKDFKCSICEELQVPPSHRVAALQHTETPYHIVGVDVAQVERRTPPKDWLKKSFRC